jgi:hypothetical protein
MPEDGAHTDLAPVYLFESRPMTEAAESHRPDPEPLVDALLTAFQGGALLAEALGGADLLCAALEVARGSVAAAVPALNPRVRGSSPLAA